MEMRIAQSNLVLMFINIAKSENKLDDCHLKTYFFGIIALTEQLKSGCYQGALLFLGNLERKIYLIIHILKINLLNLDQNFLINCANLLIANSAIYAYYFCNFLLSFLP